MMLKKKQYAIWIPLFIWGLIIFLSSCTRISRNSFVHFIARFAPSSWGEKGVSCFWDHTWFIFVKGYHVMEFFFLFLFCNWTIGKGLKLHRRKAYILSGASCFLFAISDEWHQTFVPHRGGRWQDVVVDSLGIGLAASVCWWWGRRRIVKTVG